MPPAKPPLRMARVPCNSHLRSWWSMIWWCHFFEDSPLPQSNSCFFGWVKRNKVPMMVFGLRSHGHVSHFLIRTGRKKFRGIFSPQVVDPTPLQVSAHKAVKRLILATQEVSSPWAKKTLRHRPAASAVGPSLGLVICSWGAYSTASHWDRFVGKSGSSRCFGHLSSWPFFCLFRFLFFCGSVHLLLGGCKKTKFVATR